MRESDFTDLPFGEARHEHARGRTWRVWGRIMLGMPGTLISRTTSLLLVLVFLTAQTWATCGGGGGGGMGGMGSGTGTQTYPVPWKVIHAEDTLKNGLALYWLPSSQQELEKS